MGACVPAAVVVLAAVATVAHSKHTTYMMQIQMNVAVYISYIPLCRAKDRTTAQWTVDACRPDDRLSSRQA